MREGTVERVDATLSRVRVGEELIDCTVRRKLVKFAKGTKTIVVGDRVAIEQTDRGEWVIAEVLERRSQLARPDFRGRTERGELSRPRGSGVVFRGLRRGQARCSVFKASGASILFAVVCQLVERSSAGRGEAGVSHSAGSSGEADGTWPEGLQVNR